MEFMTLAQLTTVDRATDVHSHSIEGPRSTLLGSPLDMHAEVIQSWGTLERRRGVQTPSLPQQATGHTSHQLGGHFSPAGHICALATR